MKKVRFYYDESTFRYIEVKTGAKTIAQRILICFSVALLLVLLTFKYWLPLEEAVLKARQEAIAQTIIQQNKQFAEIEKNLNKIHEIEQTYYRSILELNRMDASVWEAGTGGTDSFNLLRPEVLRQAAIRESKLMYKFARQTESFEEIEKITALKNKELYHKPAIKPIGGRLVSGFGYRPDPFHGHAHFHAGLDFTAPIGTPVKAAGNGTIITAGTTEWGYGLQIEINHGYGYVTKYAHLSATKVKIGQKVKRGEIIGLSGNSGYSTGPHLHYEVIKNGAKVNPENFYYAD